MFFIKSLILMFDILGSWDCPSKISTWLLRLSWNFFVCFLRLSGKIYVRYVSSAIKNHVWFEGSTCVKSLICCNKIREDFQKSLRHYFSGVLKIFFLKRRINHVVRPNLYELWFNLSILISLFRLINSLSSIISFFKFSLLYLWTNKSN